MVRDAIVHVLEDPEIRLDILSHENQDLILEVILKLVEVKESRKRSESSLSDTDHAHAASPHKRGRTTNKSHKQVGGKRDDESCPNCGEPTHTVGNKEEEM